jgi:hypothetical protein
VACHPIIVSVWTHTKEIMGWKRLASALLVCLMLGLSACGGGGGGGNDPSAQPSNKGDTAQPGFTLDRQAITATALVGANTIGQETLVATVTDSRVQGLVVGVPDVTKVPGWLRPANEVQTASGQTWQLQIPYDASGLAAGSYQTTLRVYSGSDATDVIGYRDVPFTLKVVSGNVSPGTLTVAITPSSASAAFQAVQGATTTQSTTVALSFSDTRVASLLVAPSPGAASANWLHAAVGRQGQSGQLLLDASAATLGAVGSYATSVRVLAIDIDGKVIGVLDVPVTMKTSPRLMMLGNTSGLRGVAGTPTHLHTTVTVLGGNLGWRASLVSPLNATLATTSGRGDLPIDLDIDLSQASPTNGAAGITVKLEAEDGQQALLLVPVTVQTPVLSASGTRPVYNAINGAPVLPASIPVTLNNGADPVLQLSSDVPWLRVLRTGQTVSAGFSIQPDSSAAALPNGSNVGHITASTTTGNTVLTEVITVELRLTAPSLWVSRSSLSFDAINGNAIPEQSLLLSTDNSQNPAVTVTSDVPWLKVVQGSGGTLTGGFSVQPDPAVGPLASGTYSGNVTVNTTTGNTPLRKVIPVSFTLTAPSFTASTTSIQLGGDKGRDLSAADLSVALGVPLNGTAWTVSSVPGWLSASRTGGTFLSNDNGLSLTPKLTALSPGQTKGNLVLSTQVNGDKLQLTVPVAVRLDQHKLVPSEVGVAFTKTPNWSRLSRTLIVRDNMSQVTTWTATSDQAWLKVTPSGRSGMPLTLTADPTGLSADVIRIATVTLKSTDPTVAKPEPIRVGLWVGSGNPSAVVSIPRTQADHFALDPIRPLMYTTNASNQDMVAYNLYTGKEVKRLSGVVSGNQGGLVSPDGSRLYLHNGASVSVVVDLDAMKVLGTLPVGLPAAGSMVMRPNGRLLLLSGGQSFDAADGTLLGPGLSTSSTWTVAADLSTVYGVNQGISSASAYRSAVDHSLAFSVPVLHDADTYLWSPGDNGEDISLSPDGSTLAAACAATSDIYGFTRFNLNTKQALATLPARPFPNNVRFAPDGKVIAAGRSRNEPADFWIYNADTSLRSSMLLGDGASATIDAHTMRLSGDGFVVVLSVAGDSLKVVPVAP